MPVSELFRRMSSYELTCWLAVYGIEAEEQETAEADAELQREQQSLGEKAQQRLLAKARTQGG